MASRPIATMIPQLLFACAIITSLPVLWFFARPSLDTSEAPAHVRHGATLYFHVIGGLSIIVAGGGRSTSAGPEKLSSVTSGSVTPTWPWAP